MYLDNECFFFFAKKNMVSMIPKKPILDSPHMMKGFSKLDKTLKNNVVMQSQLLRAFYSVLNF